MDIKVSIILLSGATPEFFWVNFFAPILTGKKYKKICERLCDFLCNDTPVPYILKRTNFFGLTFDICDGVFIPQCDTERIIELVLSFFEKKSFFRVLDLGTGTGNLSIVLAKLFPFWSFLAVDKSYLALKIAKKNAIKHRVLNRITFLESDFFSFTSESIFDIVISNPPYIDIEEHKKLSKITKKQPFFSLFSEERSVFFVLKIFYNSFMFNLKKTFFFIEISPVIIRSVMRILNEPFFKKKLNLKEIKVFNDFGGRKRFLVAIREKE